jgi:hypothetical protein
MFDRRGHRSVERLGRATALVLAVRGDFVLAASGGGAQDDRRRVARHRCPGRRRSLRPGDDTSVDRLVSAVVARFKRIAMCICAVRVWSRATSGTSHPRRSQPASVRGRHARGAGCACAAWPDRHVEVPADGQSTPAGGCGASLPRSHPGALLPQCCPRPAVRVDKVTAGVSSHLLLVAPRLAARPSAGPARCRSQQR